MAEMSVDKMSLFLHYIAPTYCCSDKLSKYISEVFYFKWISLSVWPKCCLFFYFILFIYADIMLLFNSYSGQFRELGSHNLRPIITYELCICHNPSLSYSSKWKSVLDIGYWLISTNLEAEHKIHNSSGQHHAKPDHELQKKRPLV